MSSNIQVFVRCRPLEKSELTIPVPIEVHPELHKVIVRDTGSDKSTVKTFTYDKVFSPEASQAEIYSEIVAPLVEEVLQGFNCTIFAYGQTGTGKTFTIEGGLSSSFNEKSDDPLAGIIPRSMKHLFNKISDQSLKHDICVSFLELYNEEIFDLLSKHEDLIKLRMYENSSQKGSVIVQGLEIVKVKSMEEVYDILEKGCKRRRKAVTLLNKASSRSHTIFTATVSITETSTTLEKVKKGKLNLVDLAGSENIGRSGAINKRAREAGNINQSLLALGRVITSLCEKAGHIPYRESKLTRLLQDSLGGQTKTAVIATISPSAIHIDETLNTLEYALRAKSIMNKPELNAQVTVNFIVQNYLAKIDELRKELYEMGKTKGVYIPEENIRNFQAPLEAKREEKFKLLSQVKSLSEEDKALDATILEFKKKLEEKEDRLANAKAINEDLKVKTKKAEEENKLHEAMFEIMQPMYDCTHEKYQKTLEEIKVLDLETKKKKEVVDEVLKEQRQASKSHSEIRLHHKLWNEKFRQDSERLMNDMRNTNDSVNLMTSECKAHVSALKIGFDTRKSDCEKAFQEVSIETSKAIKEFETINKNFQKDIDVSFLEEKAAKLKSVEDFEKEYSSLNENSPFEQLDQIINHYESRLLDLSTAADEWEKELASEMETLQKSLKERTNNLQSTFESTTENVKELLNKQKENLEEFNNIVSETLNVENTSKKTVTEKFEAVEQAISSLDIYCTKANEKEIDKTKRAHSCMDNYVQLGREVVQKLSNCGEICSENIDAMHSEDEHHLSTVSSEKLENLKKEVSDFSRYKKLTDELEAMAKADQNFCGIRDSVIQLLKDVDESNEQLIVPKNVRMLADSVIERGNNFVSRMYKMYGKNRTEVEAWLSEDKLCIETLTESSNRLSKKTHEKISEYRQFLEDDLLRRFEREDNAENITTYEESYSGNNTFASDIMLNLSNTAAELMLPLDDAVSDIENTVCLKHTDQTLKDGNSSMLCNKDSLKDETLQGSSKSFRSVPPISPVTRPRSKNSKVVRNKLQFPDIEKLVNDLLEDNSGDEF